MVVEPVTSCRGPTSQRVPLNPGKPELAWWTTSSMAFGRGCGKRSDRVAHYRAPGRRLGALVEGLSHGPDGIATRKTTRSAKHAQNRCWGRAQKGTRTKGDTHTCLWHAGVDVHGRCGLQPLAPWGGRGTLGGGCGGSGTQRPRGDVLAGTTNGWERRRPHGSSSDVQAGGGGTGCLDGRPLTRQHRELSGLAVGLEGLTGDGVERALGFNSSSSGSLVV
jgi:hypothetical protein